MKTVQIAGLDAIPIVQCNLGHTSQPKHLWDKDGFGYYRCPECGLAWVSPQLTDNSVSQIYATIFSNKHSKHQRPSNFSAYAPVLKKLRPYRQNNQLLDVGCFTGNFLLAAREQDWDVEGTEISESAIAYAQAEYGLKIHLGDLTSLDLPENYYDAVTLSDVIEHVSDPLETIQKIHKILRPGGILYMDTPHFFSIPYLAFKQDWNVFFPWHRTYFSVSNMQYALENSGFQVQQIEAIGVLPMHRFNAWRAYQAAKDTPSKMDSIKRPSFIKKYKNILRPIWLVAKSLHYLPFKLLSALGIHIGTKLIVYAEKKS